MALEISEVVSYVTLTDSVGAVTVTEPVQYASTAVTQFPQQFVQQKVWDTVEGNWVLWATDSMDIDGAEYPGPGTWGVHTSGYRVLTVSFTRIQG